MQSNTEAYTHWQDTSKTPYKLVHAISCWLHAEQNLIWFNKNVHLRNSLPCLSISGWIMVCDNSWLFIQVMVCDNSWLFIQGSYNSSPVRFTARSIILQQSHPAAGFCGIFPSHVSSKHTEMRTPRMQIHTRTPTGATRLVRVFQACRPVGHHWNFNATNIANSALRDPESAYKTSSFRAMGRLNRRASSFNRFQWQITFLGYEKTMINSQHATSCSNLASIFRTQKYSNDKEEAWKVKPQAWSNQDTLASWLELILMNPTRMIFVHGLVGK